MTVTAMVMVMGGRTAPGRHTVWHLHRKGGYKHIAHGRNGEHDYKLTKGNLVQGGVGAVVQRMYMTPMMPPFDPLT